MSAPATRVAGKSDSAAIMPVGDNIGMTDAIMQVLRTTKTAWKSTDLAEKIGYPAGAVATTLVQQFEKGNLVRCEIVTEGSRCKYEYRIAAVPGGKHYTAQDGVNSTYNHAAAAARREKIAARRVKASRTSDTPAPASVKVGAGAAPIDANALGAGLDAVFDGAKHPVQPLLSGETTPAPAETKPPVADTKAPEGETKPPESETRPPAAEVQSAAANVQPTAAAASTVREPYDNAHDALDAPLPHQAPLVEAERPVDVRALAVEVGLHGNTIRHNALGAALDAVFDGAKQPVQPLLSGETTPVRAETKPPVADTTAPEGETKPPESETTPAAAEMQSAAANVQPTAAAAITVREPYDDAHESLGAAQPHRAPPVETEAPIDVRELKVRLDLQSMTLQQLAADVDATRDLLINLDAQVEEIIDAAEDREIATESAAPGKFRCALYSDGALFLELVDGDRVVLEPTDFRRLWHYLQVTLGTGVSDSLERIGGAS